MLTIFRTSKDRNSRPDEPQKKPPVSPQSPAQRQPQNMPPKPPQPVSQPNRPQPQKTNSAPTVQSATTIGRDLVFEGNVTGKGSIRVEGEFNGKLDVQNEVIIGKGGKVIGDVLADIVTVEGNLKGNVEARKKININVTGTMLGDIIAPRVVVASGAVYKGKIDMETALKNAKGATPPQKQKGKAQENIKAKKDTPEPKEQNTIPGPPPSK